MKHIFQLLIAALILAIPAAHAGTVVDTYLSTVNNVPIGDNNCTDATAAGTGLGGISNSITIPAGDLGGIVDVNVQVAMTHTWRGDIQMALTDGTTTVLLANNHGGSADNYHATFDTQAPALCSAAANCGGAANCVSPPGPTCQPNQVLDAFNGAEAAGRTFTLQICDRAAGDLGQLVNWAIEVERDPPPTVVSGSYPSTVNNVAIGDNNCTDATAAGTGLGGIQNTITIPAGDTGAILDVNVQVAITHTWRGDIQMALTDGTSTVLLANNHGGSADNYHATFDTQAAALCSAAANCGGAANCVTPPGPTCQPNQVLDAFNGAEAGGRSFTLRICDRAGGDLGTLNNWTLLVDREGTGVIEADLSVTLADAPDPVTAGNNLTYTVTATNNGPNDADNVSIELPLPAGTSFVSVNGGAGAACNAASPVTCTWAGPTANGANRVAVVVATVDASATGTLNATATTTSDTADSNPGNNTADATTGIVVDADVGITKIATSVPDPLEVGSTIVYTLTASNAGPSTATGVVVSDTLPANLSYVSNSCGADFTAPTLTWTIGTLAVGAAPQCTLTVTVAAVGAVENTATISASSGDSNAGNNSSTSTLGVVVDADVGIAKVATTVPAPLEVGSTIVYTLTASNAGPSAATGVVVSDTLQANLDYVSNSCGADFTAPTLTWTIGAMAVGASLDCTLTVTVADVGAVDNTATISATSPDSNAGNNSGTSSLGVAGVPLPDAVAVPASGMLGRVLLGLMVVLLGLLVVRGRH